MRGKAGRPADARRSLVRSPCRGTLSRSRPEASHAEGHRLRLRDVRGRAGWSRVGASRARCEARPSRVLESRGAFALDPCSSMRGPGRRTRESDDACSRGLMPLLGPAKCKPRSSGDNSPSRMSWKIATTAPGHGASGRSASGAGPSPAPPTESTTKSTKPAATVAGRAALVAAIPFRSLEPKCFQYKNVKKREKT